VTAKTEAGEIPCALCPRGCKVKLGTRGECQAYAHTKQGTLESLSYGKLAKFAVEPIESDHFFHVLPGTPAFFYAAPTCNLNCSYCSEWKLSQFPIEQVPSQPAEPKAIAEQAKAAGLKLLGYTYTDPAAALEYAIDVAVAGREAGLYPIAHTAGYLMPAPMKDLASALVALNIDLKAYSEASYKTLARGSLQPALDAIKAARETPVWLEITYLVVPGYNDTQSLIKDMCKWIAENCGPATPVHFVRFFPRYKHRQLQTPLTPPQTLKSFRETAYEAGLLFAYVGNVPGDVGESTLCPKCHELLIRRVGTSVAAVSFDPVRGLCTKCLTAMPGIWK
jgi:pyruvate formate lyase activating enzyme